MVPSKILKWLNISLILYSVEMRLLNKFYFFIIFGIFGIILCRDISKKQSDILTIFNKCNEKVNVLSNFLKK